MKAFQPNVKKNVVFFFFFSFNARLVDQLQSSPIRDIWKTSTRWQQRTDQLELEWRILGSALEKHLLCSFL